MSKRICEHVGGTFSDCNLPLPCACHNEWEPPGHHHTKATLEIQHRDPTDLLNRILVRRREDDDKQSRFQQAWFLGVIAGGCEVITLDPDGTQHHHGEWRERERGKVHLMILRRTLGNCIWR